MPEPATGLLRPITGFHQDEAHDWVAELRCGHGQHVRHRPPFWSRPWVLTAEGRAQKLGVEIPCPLCDRFEMPGGLVPVSSTRIVSGTRYQVWPVHTICRISGTTPPSSKSPAQR